MRYFFVVILLLTGAFSPCWAGPDNIACTASAARFHNVNEEVLRSILNIETGSQAAVISRNPNSTIDVGIGGINSVHFPELSRHGVTPAHLLDSCNGTYTTAWLLARAVHRYGETWQGFAAYHSATPYQNHRYQVLLHNDLVRRGVKAGSILPVPPLLRR